jgi:hypothetical protein
MNNFQTFTDKTAISLSLICAIHCIFFPIIVIALPTVASLGLDGEVFHRWILIGVIPISVMALGLGCKKHKSYRIMTLGLAGLAILIVAGWFGHDLFGELGEKSLTLLGACIVASGHILNHRLCQQSQCDCRD